MSAPLSYTRDEIHSYLPTGWNLSDAPPAGGDGDRWVAIVLDGADQPWEIEISSREAVDEGRLPALQRALDRVYRASLGRTGLMG